VLVFAAWLVLRLVPLGLDRVTPIPQLISFTPFVAAASVLPVLFAALVHRWRAAATALVFAGLFAAVVIPRLLGGPDTVPVAAGVPTLRVLTVNLGIGKADPARVVDLVRRDKVDVLSVQELTPEGAERLRAAGLRELLPYEALQVRSHVHGTGLYAKAPLTPVGQVSPDTAFAQATSTIVVQGKEVLLVSAHPAPPLSEGLPGWQRDLSLLPKADPDGSVRIMAGDFNASLDHEPLRNLVRSGYTDAADAVGQGLYPTWPMDGRRLPGVQIDHVLVDRRVDVRSVRFHGVGGTDHRAVFAELALP
jgi:endonuclease/exonuclease/phosphatase (EEP) superfamily protein YafD